MVEQVDRFNYLGSLISSNGRCKGEIKRRINRANTAYNRIKKLITNKKVSVHTRKRFVKCYVWSTLMYGCETWMMNKADERRIEAAEMWFWRRLLKISRTEGISNEQIGIRTNEYTNRTVETHKAETVTLCRTYNERTEAGKYVPYWNSER